MVWRRTTQQHWWWLEPCFVYGYYDGYYYCVSSWQHYGWIPTNFLVDADWNVAWKTTARHWIVYEQRQQRRWKKTVDEHL